MTTNTQGQTAPTKAPRSAPLDLHGLYQQQKACGYTRSLLLTPSTVQNIAARLRSISAIGAVLAAGTDEELLAVGNFIQGGLIDAINILACDASYELERADEHAAALEGGAA